VISEKSRIGTVNRLKRAAKAFYGAAFVDVVHASRVHGRKYAAKFAQGNPRLSATYSSFRGKSAGNKSIGSSNLAKRPPGDLRRGLAMFYEAIAFDTLHALWRGRKVIASFLAAGLVLSLLGLLLSTKRYTADAVVQLDFGQEETAAAKVKSPPVAAMDAGVLVESEARLVRSEGMARRVVTRLRLDEDPAYVSRGRLTRLMSALHLPGADAPGPSNIDLAARALGSRLSVTNDSRSYIINITITSNSPVESARLANAFAVEYLNDRVMQRLRASEASARSALADAVVIYGDKHPSLIQARANLAAALERMSAQERLAAVAEGPDQLTPALGQGFTKAEPIAIPSGPNASAIFGIGMIGSLLAGIAFVVLLERRDTGFRTELSVPAETGVRCVGMIPRDADRKSPDRKIEQREALRSLCLAVGLAGQGSSCRVVMVTSVLPHAGKSSVVEGLAGSLEEDGRRVLIVDTTPSSHMGAGTSIDDLLGDPELIRLFLSEQSHQSTSVLRRASGLNGALNPFASFASVEKNLGQLLTEARERYDVIIIETPSAMLFSDCVFLGRFADLSLLVANWRETPRGTVVEAVRRLRENMLRVDGIVLAEIDLGQYPSYAARDQTYYLSQFRSAGSSGG